MTEPMKVVDTLRQFRDALTRIIAATSSTSIACDAAGRQLGRFLDGLAPTDGVDPNALADANTIATLAKITNTATVVEAMAEALSKTLAGLTTDVPAGN